MNDYYFIMINDDYYLTLITRMCIEDYPKRECLIHPSSKEEWILISPGVKTINPNDLDNHILNE